MHAAGNGELKGTTTVPYRQVRFLMNVLSSLEASILDLLFKTTFSTFQDIV